MPILTTSAVRERSNKAIETDRRFRKSYAARDARDILHETSVAFSEKTTHDIFLSHTIRDAQLILGVKGILEDLNYTVYVDWIDDPQLDRSRVSPVTADKLRTRMKLSKSLLYVTTENAENSKWMPWECGYFDGLKEKVAIVPVKDNTTDTYDGQEYLGLYPYCIRQNSTDGKDLLWVHKTPTLYTSYDHWIITENAKITWKH